MSPILLQHKAAQHAKTAKDTKAAAPLTAGIPISYLILFVNSMRRPVPLQPYLYHYPAPPSLSTSTPSFQLLPEYRTTGPSLPLQEFCTQFDVSKAVCHQHKEEGFTSSHTLQYIAIDDLKEMKFKLGEIASLKDAVACWSVPNQ
jgi:hypothetical protein